MNFLIGAFGWIKGRAYIILGAIFGFLVILAKAASRRADRAEERMKTAEARLKQRILLDSKLTEVDQEYSRRAIEANRANEEGSVPRNLKDSNDW